MKYNIFENVSQDDLIVSGSTSTFKWIKQHYFTDNTLFGGDVERIKLDKHNKLIIPGNFDVGIIGKDMLSNANKRLPFDIAKCRKFNLFNCDIGTVDGFPQTCDVFILRNNKLLSSISMENIKTKSKMSFEFLFECVEIKNISLTNPKDTVLSFANCDKLTHMSIDKISNDARIHLSALESFKSLKNIKCTSRFDHIDISNVPLNDFDSDINCRNVFITLTTSRFKNPKTFRKIENFKTTGIYIVDLQYMYNTAINLLLCDNSISITLETSKDQISGIFRKYVTMHNRKDYIMDCAVELVDKGYPEAAEL